MICPNCQAENREGRRFCAGCGGSLSVACTKCGFLNEPLEKFCGGCGLAMASSSEDAAAHRPAAPSHVAASPSAGQPAPGDRRPVTVMFVDLSGYTALSAKLDPEDTNRLLSRFFEVVDGLVLDFGGVIDKHIGDSVMALFGAPVAHGNDPERAIRAAVAIQDAMPPLSSEFVQDLKVHIGLALGEVVASGLGSAAHSTYTVTGDAPNIAARLMERAASGETLVADALARSTEHFAALEPMGIEQLKGLAKPLTLFRLRGLRSDRTAEPAMVGRQSELAQLVSVVNACHSSGRGASAAIRGDPGIGKSRLLREIKGQAAALGFTCVSGLVLDFGAHAGEDVLAAVTAGLLGTSPEASVQIKAEAVRNALSSAWIDQIDQPFVLDLLSLAQPDESQSIYAAMDTKARQRGMAAALVKLLHAASQDRPVLVAIEDVHWANEATLHLLALLAAAAEQCAAVVVMTTRFDGDPFDANWRAQSSGGLAVTIDLRPLRAEDATKLASGVFSEVDDFARQCVARAEGNPLFLEQLLRSKLSDGDGKLPHSIQGVVLARLDSLADADRRALQAASVLGQRFVQDDLQALLGPGEYDLAAMLHRQLLKHEGDGFLFAHALIRDGIYASLTRDTRRDLHHKAAARYADNDPALRAEHLDKAEDPLAVQAYLHAADVEAAAFRLERAIRMATRGLELARLDTDIVKLGLAVGRMLLASGQAKPAREAYKTAVAAAQSDADRCRCFIGMAAADRILTNLDEALESLRAAESIAAASGSLAMLSEIHYMRGNLHFAVGDQNACLSEHSLALAAAERANEPEWKARALSGLGDAAYLQGRVKTALRHFQDCVDLAEQHHLLRVIPANKCMIGDCMVFLLDIKGALEENMAAVAAAERIGDRFSEMFALHGVAYILFAAGHISEAEAPTEAALEIATQLGARRYEAFLRAVLAQLRLSQDRIDEANELLNAAWLLAEGSGLNFCGPIVCLNFANLLGATDEGRAWIARGEGILAHAQQAHNHIFFRTMAIDWAIRINDWSMVDRFADELVAFTAAEPLPFVDFFVNRARALSALRRNPDDQQATETLNRLKALAASVDLRLAS